MVCGLFVFACAAFGAPVPHDGNDVRSMWVETDLPGVGDFHPLENEESMRDLLDFATAKGINRVYMATYPFMEISYDGGYHREFTAEMQMFLGLAAGYDIEIEALFGATNWANPSDQMDPYSVYNWSRTLMEHFVEADKALKDAGEAGFSALHLDMEYWADGAYTGGTNAEKEEIEANYVELLDDIGLIIDDAGSDLNLAADLAASLDDISKRDNQLLDIFNALDSVNIMTYRDTSEMIFGSGVNELGLADALDLEILLSALTMAPGVDVMPWSTFFDENEVIMERELAEVTAMAGVGEFDRFAGFGIYHYETYMNMQIPEPATILSLVVSLGAIAGVCRRKFAAR